MSRITAAFAVAALTLGAQSAFAAESGTPAGDAAGTSAVADVSMRTALVVVGTAGIAAIAVAADDDNASSTSTSTGTSTSSTSTATGTR